MKRPHPRCANARQRAIITTGRASSCRLFKSDTCDTQARLLFVLQQCVVVTRIRAFLLLRVLLSTRTSENTGGDEESRRIGDFNAGNEIRAARLLNSLFFSFSACPSSSYFLSFSLPASEITLSVTVTSSDRFCLFSVPFIHTHDTFIIFLLYSFNFANTLIHLCVGDNHDQITRLNRRKRML